MNPVFRVATLSFAICTPLSGPDLPSLFVLIACLVFNIINWSHGSSIWMPEHYKQKWISYKSDLILEWKSYFLNAEDWETLMFLSVILQGNNVQVDLIHHHMFDVFLYIINIFVHICFLNEGEFWMSLRTYNKSFSWYWMVFLFSTNILKDLNNIV